MGLNRHYLDFIEQHAVAHLGSLSGQKMLELGDQVINSRKGAIPESTGKLYFANRGVDHTSFDLNGLNGSIKVDLSKSITNPEWLGQFDIVTNSGTSEHVEPFECQYECFQNVHDCLRPGGIALHMVPDVEERDVHGRWKNHCQYYYSDAFFRLLAELNGYELVESKIINGLRCASLIKTSDRPFTDKRDELIAAIAVRPGRQINPKIDNLLPVRLYRRLKKRIRHTTRKLAAS